MITASISMKRTSIRKPLTALTSTTTARSTLRSFSNAFAYVILNFDCFPFLSFFFVCFFYHGLYCSAKLSSCNIQLCDLANPIPMVLYYVSAQIYLKNETKRIKTKPKTLHAQPDLYSHICKEIILLTLLLCPYPIDIIIRETYTHTLTHTHTHSHPHTLTHKHTHTHSPK